MSGEPSDKLQRMGLLNPRTQSLSQPYKESSATSDYFIPPKGGKRRTANANIKRNQGGRAIPALTREGVLYALAFAKDPAISLFGRMVYNREDWTKELLVALHQKLVGEKEVQGWKLDPKTYPSHKDIFIKLIRVAVIELAAPALCPNCNGKYQWKYEGQIVTCPHATHKDNIKKTCYQGHFRLSQGARSFGAGVSITQWYDVWSPRYERVIYPFVRDYNDELLKAIGQANA